MIGLISMACKAQILPVELVVFHINDDEGIPENTTHIKDINNLFDDYVGNWNLSLEGKSYELFITKHTDIRRDGELLEDILLVRFKILESNNSTIEDTSALPDDNPLVIRGAYFLEGAKSYQLYFFGDDFECGEVGNVYLIKSDDTDSNGNAQLKFFFTQKNDVISSEDCTEDITFPFPVEIELVFSKQL